MGRGASIRTSYTFTKYAGDELYTNQFHEGSISFGLRGREEGVRIAQDLIRLNITAIRGKNYKAYSFGLGFRF